MRGCKRVFMVTVVLGILGGPAGSRAADENAAKGGQSEQVFQKEITKTVRLKYLLYLPQGYGEKKDQKWPLMLFLHGAGERGDDGDKELLHPDVLQFVTAKHAATLLELHGAR